MADRFRVVGRGGSRGYKEEDSRGIVEGVRGSSDVMHWVVGWTVMEGGMPLGVQRPKQKYRATRGIKEQIGPGMGVGGE